MPPPGYNLMQKLSQHQFVNSAPNCEAMTGLPGRGTGSGIDCAKHTMVGWDGGVFWHGHTWSSVPTRKELAVSGSRRAGLLPRTGPA